MHCLAYMFYNTELLFVGSADDVDVNSTGPGTYCAFVSNKIATEPETGEPIIIANSVLQSSTEPLSIVRCDSDKEYCYTLFYIDQTNKARHTILMQGQLMFHKIAVSSNVNIFCSLLSASKPFN